MASSSPRTPAEASPRPADGLSSASAEPAEASPVAGSAKVAEEGNDGFADFEAAPPPAAAATQPGPAESEAFPDDDFADFESAPTGPPGGAAIAAATGTAAGDDEDWDFASAGPVAPAVDARTQEELSEEVQGLVAAWCETVRQSEQCCGILEFLKGGGGSEAEVLSDNAADWDEWLLLEAGIPEEARGLLTSGASAEAVPVIPFTSLGLTAADAELCTAQGTRVREVFVAALGRHMQLPATLGSGQDAYSGGFQPPAAPAAGAAAPEVELEAMSGRTALGVAGAPSSALPAAEASSDAGFLADADWGLFDSVPSAPVATAAPAQAASPGVAPAGGGDVLWQALSDVGLGAPAPPPPAQLGNSARAASAALAAASAAGAVGDPAAKARGLPPKVKDFLAGLPNLSHLYSNSVAISA